MNQMEKVIALERILELGSVVKRGKKAIKQQQQRMDWRANPFVVVVVYLLTFKRGSSASRKPSPNRLNPSTPSKSAKPGAITSQGANSIRVRPSFNMLPQE